MVLWISELKKEYDLLEKLRRQEIELRLHVAKVTAAKAPHFWQSLVDQVKADCAILNDTFKDNISRQCYFFQNENENQFLLQGHTPGHSDCYLILNLNLNALCIEQAWCNGGPSEDVERTKLAFHLDNNDDIGLWGLGSLTSVVSERLIMKIIERV